MMLSSHRKTLEHHLTKLLELWARSFNTQAVFHREEAVLTTSGKFQIPRRCTVTKEWTCWWAIRNQAGTSYVNRMRSLARRVAPKEFNKWATANLWVASREPFLPPLPNLKEAHKHLVATPEPRCPGLNLWITTLMPPTARWANLLVKMTDWPWVAKESIIHPKWCMAGDRTIATKTTNPRPCAQRAAQTLKEWIRLELVA